MITLNNWDTGSTFRASLNTNFSDLDTNKADKSWWVFTWDITVPDEAYGVGWNGSLEVPTKNAVYDKIETLGGGGDMILASTQTVSWLKTFLSWMFWLRNVANTFTGFFSNTITASRTWTLPDSSTFIPIITQLLTFSWPTASRTITIPDADFTVARTDAGQTFTGVQTMTSPNFTTPVLGTPSSWNLISCTADGTDEVGFRNIPQNSKSSAYTTVMSDKWKHIYHPAWDANPRTFTIDSNANVPYPLGTAITFINRTTQVVTIAITADTMILAGTTTTGSRSLAQNGIATAIKVTTTEWLISGTWLT